MVREKNPPMPPELPVSIFMQGSIQTMEPRSGFIMQRLSGQGMAFLECDGSLVKYELAPGQSMIVDTGNVLGFTEGVSLDIQRIKGVTNALFGGEGLFNTRLTGPGTIYLQTMPLATVADVIAAHLPRTN